MRADDVFFFSFLIRARRRQRRLMAKNMGEEKKKTRVPFVLSLASFALRCFLFFLFPLFFTSGRAIQGRRSGTGTMEKRQNEREASISSSRAPSSLFFFHRLGRCKRRKNSPSGTAVASDTFEFARAPDGPASGRRRRLRRRRRLGARGLRGGVVRHLDHPEVCEREEEDGISNVDVVPRLARKKSRERERKKSSSFFFSEK